MKREIKFRAWGKNSKEFLCDKSGYGLNLKEIQNIHDIDAWELMQYTGLKDKNGKEIYEGDIVTVGTDTPMVIEYMDNICAFMATEHGAGKMFQNIVWYSLKPEIIGNIYENPELIK